MFTSASELSVAEIRDGWTVTRKHTIPMLEYCDRQGLTERVQDHRRAGPALRTCSEEDGCGSDAGRIADRNGDRH